MKFDTREFYKYLLRNPTFD